MCMVDVDVLSVHVFFLLKFVVAATTFLGRYAFNQYLIKISTIKSETQKRAREKMGKKENNNKLNR